MSRTRFCALRARGARKTGFFFMDQFLLPRRFQRGIARPWEVLASAFCSGRTDGSRHGERTLRIYLYRYGHGLRQAERTFVPGVTLKRILSHIHTIVLFWNNMPYQHVGDLKFLPNLSVFVYSWYVSKSPYYFWISIFSLAKAVPLFEFERVYKLNIYKCGIWKNTYFQSVKIA